MWKYKGQQRPRFAEIPQVGQESVWDYPRPPAIVGDSRTVEVRAGGTVIAESVRAVRVLETASPPTFYIPPADVLFDTLTKGSGQSWCEWKGPATYWDLVRPAKMAAVGWSYERPTAAFAELAGYLAFYPGKLECYVAGERVEPQGGGFYGGWVTSEIVGPWKGKSGTGGW